MYLVGCEIGNCVADSVVKFIRSQPKQNQIYAGLISKSIYNSFLGDCLPSKNCI